MRKTKVCNHCGKRKPVEKFQRHAGAKDGLRGDCAPCATQLVRNYRATGSTKINEFAGKSLDNLEPIMQNLIEAYAKYGYKVTISRRK